MLPLTYKFLIKHLFPRGKLRVLDLGCGTGIAGKVFNKKKTHCFYGVDIFDKYLTQCERDGYYKGLIKADIRKFFIETGKYDVIFLLQVIEHLSKQEALSLIRKCKKAAKEKVIISTPNGLCEQEVYDGNSYQKHRSIWHPRDLRKMGFSVYGQGLKYIYQEASYTEKNEKIMFWQRIINPFTLLLFPLILVVPELGAQLIACYSSE